MWEKLFLFLTFVYHTYSICTGTDDYNIEILIALDGTTVDVDSVAWTQQLNAVNGLITEMKNSTKVSLIQLGQQFLSTPTYKTVSELKNTGASLTQDTSATYTLRNPYQTVINAIDYGFTDNFEQQKLLIIFTTGEITQTSIDYCGQNTALKKKLIEVIVIGVGNRFSPGYNTDSTDGYAQLQFQCLTKDSQNSDTNPGFKIASSFIDMSSVTTDLKSDYFCIPDNEYLFVITEIRPGGTSEFIELLNYGRSFLTSNVAITGNIITASGSGSTTIAQGQMVVFREDSNLAQCSNCEVASIAAVFNTIIGWNNVGYSGWSVTITIAGSTARTITHTTSNNIWWTASIGESYEFYVLGGNQDFSDNWISSYNTDEGTPGGYAYLSSQSRTKLDQSEGRTKCVVTSQGGGVCQSDCYDSVNGVCTCTDLFNDFGVNFYASEADPGVCKLLPRIPSTGLGCNVYKTGKGQNELFRFGFLTPNTDMPWKLYLEYPRSDDPVYYPISSGGTYLSIDSSAKLPSRGYTATTDVNGASGNVGTTDKTDGTNLSPLTACGFTTLKPTTAPTKEPTTTPTKAPSITPTKKPTNGEPYVYLKALDCTDERCECKGIVCPSTFKATQILRSPSLDIEDLTVNTIEVIDGIANLDASFSDPIEITWNITFLQICLIGEFNLTSLECTNPIRTREELAQAIFPPLDLNETANENFTFTPDVFISPMNGVINITGSGFNRRRSFFITEYKENKLVESPTLLDGAYVAQYYLELTSCEQIGGGACSIQYPSAYIFNYEIGKQPDGGTRVNNEIPTWIWWIVIPLLIFLLIIAFLVYKYWWKKKKTDEQLEQENADLDDIIKENELGFANDLDTGHIANNPLAKVNPALTGPVNPGRVDPKQNQNQRIDEVARVKVEQFNVRQEYGQTQQQRNIVQDGGDGNY